MDTYFIGRLLLTIIFVFGLFACNAGDSGSQAGQGANQATRPKPPLDMQNKQNPLSSNESTIAEGKDTFLTNCASCHGEKGKGDGVLSDSLEPKPVPFPLDNVDDAYLFWRINEGGMKDPFNSVMPAWKTILSEEQIWEIIVYLRSIQ